MGRALPTYYKKATVDAARAMMAGGASLGQAAVSLRLGKGTLCKWLSAASLEPDYSACGRPRKFDLTEVERQALRALSLKHGSFAFAMETFRDDPECEPGTRGLILDELEASRAAERMPRWPDTVRNSVMPKAEEEALFRGKKAFDPVSHHPRKGMTWMDAEGRECPLNAMDVWMMDDYSTNQPYIVETAEGPRLCRQTLAAMDLFSAGWLGVDMIGRERDAYRGEDIVRFVLRCIEAQGTMPICLMLERGRWEGRAVHGVPLDELGAAYKGQTWGGLDELFHIVHGFSSNHKALLESSFNMLQTVLAHSGRDIGRVRGEFEQATKLALAVRAGRRDPRAAGFLEQDAAAKSHWLAMQTMNGRQRERHAAIFEGRALIPNDLLTAGLEHRTARPLPASELWRFLPLKRLATVRGGFVELEATHYRGASFRFEVNGISALHVTNGTRVLVAFDPARPELGAYVANANTKDRDGRPVGDYLITAAHAVDVPQFSLAPRREGQTTKGRADATARTAFAAVNPHRKGMTHTQAHDGQGNVAVRRTGRPEAQRVSVAASGGATAPRGVTRLGGGGARAAEPVEVKPTREVSIDVGAVAARRAAALAALEEA